MIPLRSVLFLLGLLVVGCDARARRDAGNGSFEGDAPGECSDGADNDADGDFDCDDDQCAGSPDCEGYEGDDPGECSDGADNDADGAFDCDDPGCFGAPVCQGDDDDSQGDDDDSQGDDDDSVGDDDDSLGDDDDSVGDDDDSLGDDDDGVPPGPWTATDPWLLGFNVVDAEYVLVDDLIVAVSESPNELHVIDPLGGTIDSVGLPLPPTSVGVTWSGTTAAVGHDGWVSVVDLFALGVDDTLTVSTEVMDTVVTDAGWIYAFPLQNQWEQLRCIQIATGLETLGSGTMRAGTVARPHPTQDAIYGADNGLSPSDIEKYDVSGGTSALLYDSPYHGTYSMAGNLWISESGARIFVRGGSVFLSTQNQNTDMTYNGSLAAGPNLLGWAVTSDIAGRAYILSDADSNEVWSYGLAFLGFQGTAVLPDIEYDATTSFESAGRYAFASSDGAALHVLVQAESGSGLLHDWALTTRLTSDLP